MNTHQPLLVVGRTGQVATALSERAFLRGIELVSRGRPELDLCQRHLIEATLDEVKPAIIVNAAAYTAVDLAENDEQAAYSVNADGPAILAEVSASRNVPLIHISTDYVFDGTKIGPYTESDRPAPLGVYGRSKLAGEVRVAECNPEHLILRTAWVYSPFGKNFVKTMLRVASGRDEIGVVHDQVGNPSSAHDIADTILDITAQLRGRKAPFPAGIYHMAGTGVASWAEFAEHLLTVSGKLGGPEARINRITTEEFPTPTQRPANSQLDCSRLLDVFGLVLPDWKASTETCVGRLTEDKGWQA